MRIKARKRLMKERKLAGYIQPQFAAKVGCSFQHYQGIETQRYSPSPTLAKKISSELGLEIRDLFTINTDKVDLTTK